MADESGRIHLHAPRWRWLHERSAPALYAGSVMHQRLRPARHRLRYRVFSLLLDLDELPTLARRLRLFSLNRFNLFSLHERDHGDGAGATALRAQVERAAARGRPARPAAPIRLLTMPRILGYGFNPLSVYFCHRPDGALQAHRSTRSTTPSASATAT